MVCISHIGVVGYYPSAFGLGMLGVVLFFVLSGFLMGLLYIGHGRSDGLHGWMRYAVRRVFRVYPPFAFLVVGSFVLSEWLSQSWSIPMPGDAVIAHLLLADGTAHLWTIPVEMKFYLSFPFIAFGVSRLESDRNRSISLCILLVLLSVLTPEWKAGTLDLLPHIEIFVMGVLAAQLYTHASTGTGLQWVPWNAILVGSLIALLALVPAISVAITGKMAHPFNAHYITAMPCLLIVLSASCCTGWVRTWLNSRAMQFLGAISYSLYLTHVHALKIVDENLSAHSIIKVGMILLVSLFVSWVCYRTVETPFRNLGRRIAGSLADSER